MRLFDAFKDLPDNALEAAETICERFVRREGELGEIDNIQIIEFYLQFVKFCKDRGIELSFTTVMGGDIGTSVGNVSNFFLNSLIPLKEQVINSPDSFLSRSGLTRKDKEQIQEKINSLRDQINNTQTLTEEHRNRILTKLNELQAELDKPLGDFYAWLGKLMMLGKAIKQFAEDASPLFQLVGDIAAIVRGLSPENAELMAGMNLPGLPPGIDC